MDDFLLIDEEPKKWLTAFQSLAIMLAFFALLVWSSNWNIHKPRAFIPASVFAGHTPPSLPEAKPKKDKKTINEDIKTFNKTEIALKKKQEKERKEKERKEKELADKKKRDEEAERQRLADEAAADKKKRDEEAERQRLADEAAADRKKRDEEAERQRLADEAAAGEARAAKLATLKGIYIGRIVGRLEHFVDDVPNSVPLSERNESTVATFILKLTSDGYLEDLPYLEESSGYEDFDVSAKRTILKSMPLPIAQRTGTFGKLLKYDDPY